MSIDFSPNLNSRVGLVPGNVSPPSSPYNCALCGAVDDREYFADLGLHVDRFGVVYLCSQCVTALAQRVGLPTRDEWDNTLRKLEAAETRNKQLENENASLADLNDIRIDELRDELAALLKKGSS